MVGIRRLITGLGKPVDFAALWRQGWHEIPAQMFGCFVGATGVILIGVSLKRYYDTDGNHRLYRGRIVIYRPEDPNVSHIKTGLGNLIKP
ncbi:UNVERIFIED_CONTAM: hypothetical protein RMT77_019011 [Armadillidium vulgare]